MSQPRTTAQEYRGIKRIQQACTNCRRKKAKCSGERPICGYCKRLSQDCQWENGVGGRSNTSQEIDDDSGGRNERRKHSIHDDGLATRVAAIESKLDNLTNTMNAFLPALMLQANPVAPSSNSLPAAVSLEPTPPYRESVGDLNPIPSAFEILPPPQVQAGLVDVYFSRVHNQPYSFFHEQNFRKRLADGLLPDHLKFAVLASSIRFSDDPYYHGVRHEACKSYASQSWKHIVSSWFIPESDPDLYICQAITLLSIIDSTAGRSHPAWLKIGLSVRIAQDLCLMMEPESSLSYADQEERRRVFWSIYILDKLVSCGRARPAAIDDAHCRVQLPCDELTFENGTWKKMPTIDKIFSAEDSVIEYPGPLAMVVLTSSIISRCAKLNIHEYRRGEGRLPPWDSQSEFAMLYSKLLKLETSFEMGDSISDALKRDCTQSGVINMHIAGPLVVSHAIFHICQVLLHHPFLIYQQAHSRGVKVPLSFLNRALQTCRDHASSMSELLQETRSLGCLTYFSFLGYCTTVAGTIHTLYLEYEDPIIQQRARAYLQSDLVFLEEFSCYWNHGNSMITILQRLVTSSAASSSLVNASPHAERNLNDNLIENLWASVDYTTMSQSLPRCDSSIGPSPPFNFNSVLSPNAAEGQNFDTSNFAITPGDQLNNGSASSELLYSNLSPMNSFFGGNSTDNFGF